MRLRACRSPKDTFITVYGRKPVLEALDDEELRVDKVVLAEGLRGEPVRAILAAALARRRAGAAGVGAPGEGAGRQRPPRPGRAGRRRRAPDGARRGVPRRRSTPPHRRRCSSSTPLTNPANVGMLLRTATAAGLDGVLLPRRGVPAIDPLVVKASAGIAFRAPVLRAATVGGGVRRAARGRVRRLWARRRGRSLLDAELARARRAGAGQRDRRALADVRRECATGCWPSPCTAVWSRWAWRAPARSRRSSSPAGGGSRPAVAAGQPVRTATTATPLVVLT